MKRSPLKRKKSPPRTRLKKDINALLGEGKVFKASTFTAKPKPMKKIAAKNKGWYDVALEIWNERPHYCEVSGVFLGDEPRPEFFSHLLPRGTYPDFKRDKRNIILKSRAAHNEWHKYGPRILSAYPEWQRVTDRYYELQRLANGL